MKKISFFVICALCLAVFSQNIMANNINNCIYQSSIKVELLGPGPGTGGNYKEVRVTVYREVTETYENRYYYDDGDYRGYIPIYNVNKIPDQRTGGYILQIEYKGIVYRNS